MAQSPREKTLEYFKHLPSGDYADPRRHLDLTELAKRSPKAQLALGNYYLSLDRLEFLGWIEKAANKGLIEAKEQMSVYYISGLPEYEELLLDMEHRAQILGNSFSHKLYDMILISQDFHLAIEQLSEETKLLLIDAVIGNDKNKVIEILNAMGVTHPSYFVPTLDTSFSKHFKPSNLNATTHSDTLISRLMRTIVNTYYVGDLNDRELRVNTMTRLFQRIPESILSIRDKYLIAYNMGLASGNDPCITHYSYSESLVPLPRKQETSPIDVKKLADLGPEFSVDRSEAIILVYSFLKHQNNTISLRDWNHIGKNYIETHYEVCEYKLLDIARRLLNREEYDLIEGIFERQHEVILHKNDSRRFFENKLAQFHLGHDMNIEGISRISSNILNKSVHSIEEAETAILDTSEIYPSDAFFHKYTDLDKLVLVSRDSQVRYDYNYRDTTRQDQETAYSRNKGLMRSLAPNFYNELAKHNIRNKLVDTRETSPIPMGYSKTNFRAPFIASLSGHAVCLASLLNEYVASYPHSTHLQADLNNFIKGYIAVYISRGYHSYKEITDIFADVHIQTMFGEQGIVIELDFSQEAIDLAFDEAAEYTLMTCKRKLVLGELSTPSISDDSEEDRSSTPKP